MESYLSTIHNILYACHVHIDISFMYIANNVIYENDNVYNHNSPTSHSEWTNAEILYIYTFKLMDVLYNNLIICEKTHPKKGLLCLEWKH